MQKVKDRIIAPLSDIVEWDRYRIRDETEGGYIFGWIKRDEGNYDFVVLNFQKVDDTIIVSYNTSSKKYSKEIGDRLGCKDNTYAECRPAGEIVPPSAKLVRWQKEKIASLDSNKGAT